jgi:hypothetical protein
MAVTSQQARIQHYMTTSDASRFASLLGAPELFATPAQPNSRVRQFPPVETLSMFMAQSMKQDRSCQGIVNDTAVKRQLSGLSPCSTHRWVLQGAFAAACGHGVGTGAQNR